MTFKKLALAALSTLAMSTTAQAAPKPATKDDAEIACVNLVYSWQGNKRLSTTKATDQLTCEYKAGEVTAEYSFAPKESERGPFIFGVARTCRGASRSFNQLYGTEIACEPVVQNEGTPQERQVGVKLTFPYN